jgi:hypothetical protein
MSDAPDHSTPDRFGIPAPTPLWRMVAYSLAVCLLVVFVALLMQEAIYEHLLHDKGPLRIVGTTIAALIAFGFVLKYQIDVAERQRRNLRRFEVIGEMNDQIRNAVQALACLKYASDLNSADAIRKAVEVIDAALQGIANEPAMANLTNKKKTVVVRSDRAKSHRA